MPKRPPKCKKCGEPIAFVHRPGFVIKGQSKYLVVNADDGRSHRPRCDLLQALRAAKLSGNAQLKRLKQKQRASAPASTEGVQLDAFETA